MINSNQLDFREPTLQQVADLCSEFGFACAGEADLACLRALLREGSSRWCRPAPAPAGEVGKVPTKLIDRCCDAYATACGPIAPDDYDESDHRVAIDAVVRVVAAEILKRQAAPVPVALSERPWEREGWCDDEGRCWAFNDSLPAWEFLSCTESRKWADLFLPFDALPLPSGEVE